MRYKISILILALLILSCSKTEMEKPIIASPYTLQIELKTDIDTSLVQKFNKHVVDDRVPKLKGMSTGRLFPQILPGIMLVSVSFVEGKRGEAMAICYDTLSGRFYPLINRFFVNDFNLMIADRFDDGITEEQAFLISAAAVYLKYRPRIIVCRPADLFLEPRLRQYINETYTAAPGKPTREFSSLWWGWEAFPSANSDYRSFYATYRDSILSDRALRDMPDDVVGIPTVEKDGMYHVVTFYGLPPQNLQEIHRYRVRLASDGQIERESSDLAFYY